MPRRANKPENAEQHRDARVVRARDHDDVTSSQPRCTHTVDALGVSDFIIATRCTHTGLATSGRAWGLDDERVSEGSDDTCNVTCSVTRDGISDVTSNVTSDVISRITQSARGHALRLQASGDIVTDNVTVTP